MHLLLFHMEVEEMDGKTSEPRLNPSLHPGLDTGLDPSPDRGLGVFSHWVSESVGPQSPLKFINANTNIPYASTVPESS